MSTLPNPTSQIGQTKRAEWLDDYFKPAIGNEPAMQARLQVLKEVIESDERLIYKHHALYLGIIKHLEPVDSIVREILDEEGF